MSARLLRDIDLEALASGANPAIERLPDRRRKVDSRDDPIQAASIDLHAGEIFCPGVAFGQPGSEAKSKTSHMLGKGETVVVRTRERFSLPKHIAGIGFGCTSLARQGILTPTIGHIDPGWVGHLKVVLINMGSATVPLRDSQHIGTVLLFDLGGDARAGYADRNKDEDAYQDRDKVRQDVLDSLAKDFGDFRATAKDECQKIISDARFDLTKSIGYGIGRIPAISLVTLLVAGAMMVAFRMALDGYERWYANSSYSQLAARVETLEKEMQTVRAAKDRIP